MPSKFGDAIDKVCIRTGEGAGFLEDDYAGENDAGLDVVAWKPIDDRPGKVVLFGACATGVNWEDKLDELRPKHIYGTFVRGSNTLAPAKAFFTPRVIPQEHWRSYTSRAGILFDRCRVSILAPELPESKHHGDAREWMRLTVGRTAQGAT